jgi:hypothetical protein
MQVLGRAYFVQSKADMSGSGMLPCKLALKAYFAGRKSLL